MRFLYRTAIKKTVLLVLALSGYFTEIQAARELTIEQARALAMTQSLNIESQIQAYLVNSDNEKAAKWVYEPEFQAIARQEITDVDNFNVDSASSNSTFTDREDSTYLASLQSVLPTGGTIALENRFIDRIDNFGAGIFNNNSNIYRRQFQAFAGINFQQPLLKKAESLNDPNNRYAKVQIQLAEKQSEIAFQKLRQDLSEFLAGVEISYWELNHAIQLTKTWEQSVASATQILADNKERVRLGRMADLELLETESEVAQRETELKDASIKVSNAQAKLYNYFSEVFALMDEPLIPTEVPSLVPINETREEALSYSLQNHPLYLQKKEEAERQGLVLLYAENQRLPQLDLNLSYGFNGLADTVTNSLKKLDDFDKVSWTAAVQLNVPILGNRQAYHQMAAAKRNKRKALIDLKETETQILNNIHSAYVNLKIGFETQQRNIQNVEFKEELLEAELVKLDEGKSNSREVFEVEKKLTEAKVKELEKVLEYQKYLIVLSFSKGKFLAERNIDFEKEAVIE